MLSEQITQYISRSKKSIQDWVNAYAYATYEHNSLSKRVPHRYKLVDLYDRCQLDLHLSGLVMQRDSRVMAEDVIIEDSQGNILKEETDLFAMTWLQDYLSEAQKSLYYGHALIELDFENLKVKSVDARNVVPEFGWVLEKPTDRKPLAVITDDDYQNNYVLIHRGLGLLLKAAPTILMKSFVQSAWVESSETHGQPLVSILTDVTNEDSLKKLETQIAEIGRNRTVIASSNDQVKLNAVSPGSETIYKEFLLHANSELSKLVVGQTGTSEEKSYKGSSEIHKSIAEEIASGDRRWLASHINQELMPRLVTQGLVREGSRFRFNVKKPEPTMAEKVQAYQLLLGHFDVDPAQVAKDFGIPVESLQEKMEVNPPIE